MESIYLTLNNIQTHVLTWDDPFNCKEQDVVIGITGNPGLPDFYTEFGAELNKHTGLPVCIVGHAGHEVVPDINSNVLKSQEHLFNLDGQLEHKLQLICNHIDSNCKLHLIGHSIGAWLVMELLEKNNDLFKRVSSVNLLFPTIQKMAETKNGKFINNFVRKIHGIVLLLFYLLYLVPEFITLFVIKVYLKYKSISLPNDHMRRILKYVNPKVGEKVLLMAYDEMDRVVKLNFDVIDKVKHKCNIIYGSTDDWAPPHYMEELKDLQPPLRLKEVNIDHTFVLQSSEKVAEMVSDFIKTKL